MRAMMDVAREPAAGMAGGVHVLAMIPSFSPQSTLVSVQLPRSFDRLPSTNSIEIW